MDKYDKLARFVKLCAKDIAKDKVNKIYSVSWKLGIREDPVFEIIDDSGYRSIFIGDTSKGIGSCNLYTDCADTDGKYTYRCFPPVKVIADRLRAMAAKETFYAEGDPCHTADVNAYDGGNMAMHIDRINSKDGQRAIRYFAKAAKRFADRVEADPRTAEEIYESI